MLNIHTTIRWTHAILNAFDYRGQPFLYSHEKIDGHRLTIFKQSNGDIVAVTKQYNVIDISQFPFFNKLASLPVMTSLDCEIYVLGKPVNFVKTAIATPGLWPKIKLSVFAVPYYDGKRKYAEPLEWMADRLAYHQLQYPPFFRYNTMPDTSLLLSLAKNKGIEGYVLKRANYCNWYKLKVIKTLDAVVTGFVPGKGKYSGMVGALRVNLFDSQGQCIEIATVGGMDDKTRFAIEVDADVGRICEVSYQCVGSKGRLRHPRFERWRDDEKLANQCTTEQDKDFNR